ncbi:MAG: branched-chain amino acid aminotransferase [Ruminococcaceae bacterium]|nr:branched-chain amino acid aminotransferase [Oscillospiraceae bacterium]
MLNIKIERTASPKTKPDYSKLGFGKYFTDHMFLMNYSTEKGWHDARIVPYGPLPLDPSSMVFHYAQELFEGLKAYRKADGKIQLFRPMKNIERMNATCDRLCVPQIPAEDVLQAIKAVVEADKDWVPYDEGTSLYIRPFIIATDPMLGVHPSHTYIFAIILSPVGSYYAAGINPVKIFVEREYVRCVKGGTGRAKAGGNYAASLIGQKRAEDMGCAQVLWLDGVERKYIDEVGAMNVFFVIDGTVITPELTDGNILPGVTRASCVELLKKWGVPVEERKLSIDEVMEAHANGKLDEAFGSGTAAVISPIGELYDGDTKMVINNNEIGPVAKRLYDAITGIQWGKTEDIMGWIEKID